MTSTRSFGIRFRRGCLSGHTVALRQGETTIGRSSGNAIVLPDVTVSRIHARLGLCGFRLNIEDCGSRSGTLVNGRLIRDVVTLRPGDRIVIGNQEIDVLPRGELPSSGRQLHGRACTPLRQDPRPAHMERTQYPCPDNHRESDGRS